MQEESHLSDIHDESYFASFADMLVGIIFIFIIMLMLVANNYQEATEAVIQANQSLQEARNEARDRERDRIRDAERDRIRDEAHDRELASIKAEIDTKALQAVRAMEEVKALEAAKAYQEAKAQDLNAAIQNNQVLPGAQAISGLQALNQPALPKEAQPIDPRQKMEAQQALFNDTRTKLLTLLQNAMAAQGFAITANTNQGALLIPEHLLFEPNQKSGDLSARGQQALALLADLLKQYLPCVSPTVDPARLGECASAGLEPNDGLEVIYIDDYPNINATKEEKLMLSVQRVISVFSELKQQQPYLDKQLKNNAGAPILDIKVNQARRKSDDNTLQDNPALNKNVVLRFMMRRPTSADSVRP